VRAVNKNEVHAGYGTIIQRRSEDWITTM